jgi:C4-dicarboxylate-specific signal transduction histidine kinase
VRDVTERRQVEESLRQTQKLEVIGQLTGGVAHDFNNLLTAVLGNIELAARRTRDQNVLGALKSASTAAERGAKLTGQLLAFARKQHLAPRVVSLNELVSSCVSVRGAGGRVAVPARGENRAPPRHPLSKTNKRVMKEKGVSFAVADRPCDCQVKFELIQQNHQ